jgi:hypothetical protein
MRAFKCGFIVLFMAMLVLPFVFVDLSSGRISVEENRMLAERPNLADMRGHPGTFIRDFDAWFKDSIGFRKQLIKLYQMIDKNQWLNTTVRYSDGRWVYLIGQKGHHYFAAEGYLIRKFQGKQFFSDKQLADMADKLEMVKNYLDSKGIPLVVMLCTDKESVYSEFYPKSIKQGPEPIQLDIITNYLRENTSVDIFNIRQALLAEKNNYPLYNLTSDLMHYSEIGAFFAYRELMKHINIHFPKIVPYELNDIEIKYDENGIPGVSLKDEIIYVELESSFWEEFNLLSKLIFSWHATEKIGLNFPVILFFSDSYTAPRFLCKYFSQHFGRAIYLHFYNLKYFEEIINCYKPNIVVFESAEFMLQSFAIDVVGIPELP